MSLSSFTGLAAVILTGFGMLCTLLGIFVKLMFRGELATFKDDLRKELREGYVDAKVAAAQMRPVEIGLAKTTERIDEVERYAHMSRHEWANQVMNMQRDMQVIESRVDKLENRHRGT